MPLDLRVLGATPFAAGFVVHRLPDADDVTAASEAKLLHHADALAVVPVERNQQLIAAIEAVFERVAREFRQVIRFGSFVRRAQPGLDEAEVRHRRTEQLHENVRLVLRDRVVKQHGLLQRAAPRAYFEVEHIGRNTDDFGIARARACLGRCAFSFWLRRGRRVFWQFGKIAGVSRALGTGRTRTVSGRFRLLYGLRAVILDPGLVR